MYHGAACRFIHKVFAVLLDEVFNFPKSSHRREGLSPRCRLFATWGYSMFQGLGCSPIKAVRELGSECRETVQSAPFLEKIHTRPLAPLSYQLEGIKREPLRRATLSNPSQPTLLTNVKELTKNYSIVSRYNNWLNSKQVSSFRRRFDELKTWSQIEAMMLILRRRMF